MHFVLESFKGPQISWGAVIYEMYGIQVLMRAKINAEINIGKSFCLFC